MRTRMTIPCTPRWINGKEENLEMYKSCRMAGYNFLGFEKYTDEKGINHYAWVLELVTEGDKPSEPFGNFGVHWVNPPPKEKKPEPPKEEKKKDKPVKMPPPDKAFDKMRRDIDKEREAKEKAQKDKAQPKPGEKKESNPNAAILPMIALQLLLPGILIVAVIAVCLWAIFRLW